MKVYVVYEVYDHNHFPHLTGIGKDYETGKKIAENRISEILKELIDDGEIEEDDMETINGILPLQWEEQNYGFVQTKLIQIPYLPCQMFVEERQVE